MKRKNAFTLIELLAVLVILAVIALIVFPMVGNVINSSKEKAFLRSVEGLEDSAKLDYQKDDYRGDRTYQYENGNFTLTNVKGTTKNENIKVEGIIENGIGNVYIDSEGDVEVKIWNDDLEKCAEKSANDHTVKITDTIKELCAIDFVSVPIITLNGDTTMTVYEGETFTDPGYTATYRGVDITSNVQVSGTVNTSVANTYTLTYSATYNGKDAVPVERVVNVVPEPKTFTEVMEGKIESGEVTRDTTPDQNLRYVGSNPNNYVSFNGELWRIIGVFDGQTKIIRNEYYSTSIVWDASYNNWAEADLQEELNGTYLTSIQTNDPTSYGYIDLEHVWNIGGTPNYNSSTRSDFYNAERSNTISSSMTSSTWTGAIGLMYPSDYGYASSGTSTSCDTVEMYNWQNYSECYSNSWLYDSSNYQWTLTPHSDGSSGVFVVYRVGYVNLHNVFNSYGARPVLFLKSDVGIVDGLGTDQQPFILGT